MSQKFHNNESFILEECHYCKKELENIDDILIDENDHYCCIECDRYYSLNAKECISIN